MTISPTTCLQTIDAIFKFDKFVIFLIFKSSCLFSSNVIVNLSFLTNSIKLFMADRPAGVILSSPKSAFHWFNFNSDKIIYNELSEREI